MVKTNSPLCSIEASGTLANLLTFLTTRKGATIRKRVRPRDPKSGGQLARRACFDFLTTNWSPLSAGAKASWTALPKDDHLSDYNGFVQHNLTNWSNWLAPGAIYPLTRTGAVGAFNPDPSADVVGNTIEITMRVSPLNANWGATIYASLDSGFSTALTNCIMVKQLGDTTSRTWTWTPPSAGPWFFNSRLFTIYGLRGAEHTIFTPP